MADGSRYLQCDACDAVLDKRPPDDWKDGGTYRPGSEQELFDHAKSLGWSWAGDPREFRAKHYCPKHTGEKTSHA